MTKGHILADSTCLRSRELPDAHGQKGEAGYQAGARGADGARVTGDSFGSDRCRGPGDDGGQGCTRMGKPLRPVAGHVTMVTFMLCVFYHNEKKEGGEGATGHH